MLGKLNCRAAEYLHTREAKRWRFRPPMIIAVLLVLAVPLLAACGNTNVSPTLASGGEASPSAASTPQATSSLPLTVTSGGVAVTLGLIDSTSTATRFNFSITLTASQMSQPTHLLGDNAAADVQVDGITAGPNDPYVTESDVATDNPYVELALDYQSPFPNDHTVTITIQHLTLPIASATPSTTKPSTRDVDGPGSSRSHRRWSPRSHSRRRARATWAGLQESP